MTVFLGDSGQILLERKGSDQAYVSLVNPSDVRDDVNRFSVDFAHEQFITGDRIEITTSDGKDITWIDHPDVDNSFTRYGHIDEAGGIRLYDSFSDAIAGEKQNSIQLKQPPTDQEVVIRVVSGEAERCLAEVASFQITTTRETVDITNLGAYYRKQFESGLIQGQGQIECMWRNPGAVCSGADDEDCELDFSGYLARLCLRLVHGAAFHGYFYIYSDADNSNRSVWYESDTCLITNVAVNVSPSQRILTTINFVTSGPITLREGYIPYFLAQESDGLVLQENRGRIELDNPD